MLLNMAFKSHWKNYKSVQKIFRKFLGPMKTLKLLKIILLKIFYHYKMIDL